MNRRANYVVFVIAMVVMVAIIAGLSLAIANREWIYDYFRGASYEPAGEMARIREDLQLTDRGRFVFNAAQPVLSGRDSFNSTCRSAVDTEVAVLGCYTGGNIYIYNIDSAELKGIRELTTAHELLHAVWARMSDEEKSNLRSVLEQVYSNNDDILKEELDTYTEAERLEELYVRAGTEIADLPDALEKHYADVFSNQDLIVGYYNSYITVFKEIEAEMDALKQEMDGISAQVELKKAEYEYRINQLNSEIDSFNECANTLGCFATESDFYARRGILLAEQDSVDAIYDEINVLIDEYNEKVREYNADVTRGEQLNQMINSNAKVEEIK